ncbi:MAG: hypothetical protein ISR84_04065 [Kiritimatiellales bacterium]|nr:hypothetical protein [Kiritimatiellales bacterium]
MSRAEKPKFNIHEASFKRFQTQELFTLFFQCLEGHSMAAQIFFQCLETAAWRLSFLRFFC